GLAPCRTPAQPLFLLFSLSGPGVLWEKGLSRSLTQTSCRFLPAAPGSGAALQPPALELDCGRGVWVEWDLARLDLPVAALQEPESWEGRPRWGRSLVSRKIRIGTSFQAAKAAPGFVGESSSPQSPAEQVLGNHSSRILYPRHKSLLPKMMNADMDAVDAENQVELEEKTRLINQVLELQHTLEDLSARVDAVKEENLKLKSENQVLGQYIENLMSASSVFQTTDTKSKRK
uniref:Short coiled-coil protein n=1 Tax=Macaca mulatta TaxID=9544 RepID=A0A5F7ZZL5_MACMU